MFSREGFKWDVGVHAIGNFTKGKSKKLFDRIQSDDKKIKWTSLGNPYDTCYFPDNIRYDIYDNKKEFIKNLKRIEPSQTKQIDKYCRLCI